MGYRSSNSAQVISPGSMAIELFGLNHLCKTCFLRSLQDNFSFAMSPTKTPEKATVSISHHEGVVYDLGHTVGLPRRSGATNLHGCGNMHF
jgi:hypothetical protein